jgi:5-methylcytosine-specific restriction endonuclease McrA
MEMSHCVLLNADFTFLNLIDWKRAVCLLAKGKVEVLKQSDSVVKSSGGIEFKIPSIMRLIKLIRTIYRTGVAFNKKNILVRDGFKCAYCGEKSQKLTIDHIIPRSRGGKDSFENCVAACRSCNRRKGGRIPSEANMHLVLKPYQPTVSEFLRMRLKRLGINDLLKDIGFL